MTSLLQKAFAEIEKLPSEDQDAIAAWLLAEVEDERGWSTRFVATTNEQWDRMVAEVRRDVAGVDSGEGAGGSEEDSACF